MALLQRVLACAFVVALSITGLPVSVHAQNTASRPSTGGSMPRVEVGGSVSGILFPGGGTLAPGVRLGVNLTPRWAIEGSVDSMRFQFDDRASDISWLYFLQVKHTIKPGAKSGDGIFLTYGGAGGFSYHKWKAQEIPLGGGRTLIAQEATRWELNWPLYPTVGAGLQRRLASWAAFRADALLLADPSGGFAARFTGGITIPVGGFGE